MEHWVSKTAIQKLQALNYEANFALVVLEGGKPSGGYSVKIVQVAVTSNRVVVAVKLLDPDPLIAQPAVMTSPYQVVSVKKKGRLSGKFEFELMSDGKSIEIRSVTFP